MGPLLYFALRRPRAVSLPRGGTGIRTHGVGPLDLPPEGLPRQNCPPTKWGPGSALRRAVSRPRGGTRPIEDLPGRGPSLGRGGQNSQAVLGRGGQNTSTQTGSFID